MIEYAEGPGHIAAWDQTHHEALLRLRGARAFVLVALEPDAESPCLVAASKDMTPAGMALLLAITARVAANESAALDEDVAA